MADLDLSCDIVTLTRAVCDIPSESEQEETLADAVEHQLSELPHLRVIRQGNVVLARTEWGCAERVILAGHLDTVPVSRKPNLPTWMVDGELWGRGTVDMKGGVAVMLRAAYLVREAQRDITFVFYDCEEIAADRNGLRKVVEDLPEWLQGDMAILLEPTGGNIEGGCKGTLRVKLTARGVAAHSGRPWVGDNAVHRLSGPLSALAAYEAQTVTVDGLDYREGLSAVLVEGGGALNVIPDEASLIVNYRFAPNSTPEDAVRFVEGFFAPWLTDDHFSLEVTDLSAGARPGLQHPAMQSFVQAVDSDVMAKQGWTDVARFSALGVPAVNWGPGDPLLCHADDERVPIEQLRRCEERMVSWLQSPAS